MDFGLIVFVSSVLALIGFRLFVRRQDKALKILETLASLDKLEEDAVLSTFMGSMRTLSKAEKFELLQEEHKRHMAKIRLYVAIAISMLVLLSALYVVLAETHSNESQKWAFGAVGTIIGYWLKA